MYGRVRWSTVPGYSLSGGKTGLRSFALILSVLSAVPMPWLMWPHNVSKK